MNVGELIRRNAKEEETASRTFMLFEDQKVTHGQYYEESLRYARLFDTLRPKGDVPFHVGIIMENYPEFVYAFGGCALSGAVLVGLNTIQKGRMLAGDVEFCDCRLLITERKFLKEIEPYIEENPLLSTDEVLVNTNWEEEPAPLPGFRSLKDALDAAGPGHRDGTSDPFSSAVEPEDNLMIIFTSGSSGAPKGVLNSHKKMIGMGEVVVERANFTRDEVAYAVMPMFHSNPTFLAILPAMLTGGAIAFRPRFSSSNFLSDVRKFGATYFSYVGKPLAYILSTPEKPDDHINPLRVALGNGASAEQQEEFLRRFGLKQVVEVYGATELGAFTVREAGDPRGSVGALAEGVRILNEDGRECPAAEVDQNGLLRNYEEAVGEIVNTAGVGRFEGYYKNPDATSKKARGGMFHTDDLGYYRVFERDGRPVRYLYFVGRTDDWIRKDGENFLAEPIEEILNRNEDIFLSSVYGVPCDQGDEYVMASIVLREGREFDPKGFHNYCLGQKEMSPKWIPDFVRIIEKLPQTDTLKILRRELKREGFRMEMVGDPIYWREKGEDRFKRFDAPSYERLRERFARSGREDVLRY